MFLVSPESSLHSLSGDTGTPSSGGQEPPQSGGKLNGFLSVLFVHNQPPPGGTANRVQLWFVSGGDFMSKI